MELCRKLTFAFVSNHKSLPNIKKHLSFVKNHHSFKKAISYKQFSKRGFIRKQNNQPNSTIQLSVFSILFAAWCRCPRGRGSCGLANEYWRVPMGPSKWPSSAAALHFLKHARDRRIHRVTGRSSELCACLLPLYLRSNLDVRLKCNVLIFVALKI